jgi:hypothetical protein
MVNGLCDVEKAKDNQGRPGFPAAATHYLSLCVRQTEKRLLKMLMKEREKARIRQGTNN